MLTNWLLGSNLSILLLFLIRKVSLAGFGLLANTVTIPAGNESIISPLSLTWQRVSSVPRKYECTISWKATAKGIVSARPMVNGDGPLDEPTPIPAVRNSKLATLSALEMVAGETLPLGDGPSLLEGGLGIIIDPVGVDEADCLGGKTGVMSPTSVNKSPSWKIKEERFGHKDEINEQSMFQGPTSESSMSMHRRCGLWRSWRRGKGWRTLQWRVRMTTGRSRGARRRAAWIE